MSTVGRLFGPPMYRGFLALTSLSRALPTLRPEGRGGASASKHGWPRPVRMS